jgi:hypothetical protein
MMHPPTILAPVLLGFFVSTALGHDNNAGGGFCIKRALNHLSCRYHVPHACIPELATQAVDFCSSYLGVTSTTLVPGPQVTTVTTTKTQTLEATATETSTSTAETTTTEISTATTTTATSSTTLTSLAPPQVSVVVPRAAALSDCPPLSEIPLTRVPAPILRSLCNCLGITAATTVVVPETAAASSTTVGIGHSPGRQ